MKVLVKAIIIGAVLLFFKSGELTAQPYMHAMGIRAGYSSGITYKGFLLHRMSAFQVDFLYNRHGLNLGVLYAYHWEPFQKNSRTFVYLGSGAFGGEWKKEVDSPETNESRSISMGLAAVAGIEYTLRDLPLNFSLEWKPMLNIYEFLEPDFFDVGLSIRYRFGR